MPFALGQRWMSDTESELGLGTVIKLEGRMVTIIFPATGETRLFARENAPLTRVIFNPEDEVQGPEDWFFRVESVEENDHQLMVYHGRRTDNQEVISLPETHLHYNIRFNKPQERLFAGQIDRLNRFSLRYYARHMMHKMQTSETLGMLGARVGLIAHQLWIAHEVGSRHAPRVLLADEVGLGKTIEAGMILHQQLLTGRAQRVLIVVPESLCHQWLIEMLRRFNLHFSIFDEERCVEAYADYHNPFDSEQLVICSIDLLRKKKRFEQALDADWDMLVVDEAHHLQWSKEKPSRAYQVIEALSQEVPGVLLLTATPDQLGHESHFARLRLLDSDRFFDYSAFIEEEKSYQNVVQAAQALSHEHTLSAEEATALEPYMLGQDVNQLNRVTDGERALLKQKWLKQLLDCHGTGRLLFRNVRQSIQGFPQRHFSPQAFALPEQYKTAMRVMQSIQSQQTQAAKIAQLLSPETLYQEFDGHGAGWWQFDPRVEWLLKFLQDHKSKKVLIIASTAQIALVLEEALRARAGIRATVFHEGMSILERDKAGAYFAQVEGGAQALICSEIGSEGRNFQFASDLVLFDLPINPDLLEQRIGRLDRIGQTQDVHLHVPYFEGTAQEFLVDWYHFGLNAFEQTCPTGHELYQIFLEPFEQNLLSYSKSQAGKLLKDVAQKRTELTHQLEQGRDRLLEMNSHGGQAAQQLVDKLLEQDQRTDFIQFILSLWDIIGIDQEDKGEKVLVLRPNEHMLFPYPGIPDDGLMITFDRDAALSRDEVTFMTPEHPLVQTGIDLILGSDTGSTSVALLKNKAMPVGTLFVELMYSLDVSAPKASQVFRYLPATPIRILLDQTGQNLSQKVDFSTLDDQLAPVNRHTAIKLINASQTLVHPLIHQSNELADSRAKEIQAQAKKSMQTALEEELNRLTQLKAVNPHIRQVELDYIQDQMHAIAHYIENSQLQLDAIRVILVSHK
tara:strand:+ start:11830 stop:14718 length:2889 start_codon:yes stop_codon:yes gene_type:complete